MGRKITITMEATTLGILRGRASMHAWCSRCSAEREVVALDEIRVSNAGREELERWLSSEDLHRLQSSGQSPLVCLHSLLARMQKPKS